MCPAKAVSPSVPPTAVVRRIGAAYVEFFKNVPLLVWMFFWYFAAPQFLPASISDWLNRHGGEFVAAVAALGVYHGARFAEVIRAGIQSVPTGQMEAALSTGLGVVQAYRLILVPIALRIIIPPSTNETLNLLKNSSVALTISVAELTFQTRQIETYTAKGIEALTAGTLIYLMLCLGIAAIMARLEGRFAIPGMIARGGGKIINICSMTSELGRETVSAYAAAKGGLKMLTRNICSEYGAYNIQCNGIGPGYIATPQTAPLREPQPDGSRHPFDQFIIAKTPAGRWGEAEDLGGPAVFLASAASDFVNGLILYVDGGILAYIGKQPG